MDVPRLGQPDHQKKTRTSRVLPSPSRARAMRILFLTNAHNGMSQALYLNLTEQGHQVTFFLVVFMRENVFYTTG